MGTKPEAPVKASSSKPSTAAGKKASKAGRASKASKAEGKKDAISSRGKGKASSKKLGSKSKGASSKKHGDKKGKLKAKKSPATLKAALKQNREPMGGAAGTHGHRKHKHGGDRNKSSRHLGPAVGKKHRHHHHHHHHHHRSKGPVKYEKLETSDLAKSAVRAFWPVRALLSFCGRFPLTISKDDFRGTYSYKCNFCLPHGMYFVFVTILLVLFIIVSTFNYITSKMEFHLARTLGIMTLNWDNNTKFSIPLHEKVLFQRHLMFLIVIFTNVIHALLGSFNVFRKRKYFVRYFTFWSQSIERLHMDVGSGVRIFSYSICFIFAAFIGGLCVLYTFNIGASARGGATVVSILLFRPYTPDLLKYQMGPMDNLRDKTYITGSGFHWSLYIYQLASGIFILLVFLWSKSMLLIFLFKCRLLVNAVGIWNGRVYATVLRGREFNLTEEGKSAYKILFKDHCILMDLMEGTDRFFSVVIEAFFGLHITSLIVELYFVFLYMKAGEDGYQTRINAELNHYFIRPYDWATALAIAVHNIAFLYLVSTLAADVGDEAISGLEVVRRKTMLGRKTDEELYFNFSMYYSYVAYKSCVLRGGGYFEFNKDYIIGIFAAFLSYFIILQQFRPFFDKREGEPAYLGYDTRARMGQFLYKLENLADCHWVNPHDRRSDPSGCYAQAPGERPAAPPTG